MVLRDHRPLRLTEGATLKHNDSPYDMAAQQAEWERGRAACRAKQAARNAEAEAAYRARWAAAPVLTFG